MKTAVSEQRIVQSNLINYSKVKIQCDSDILNRIYGIKRSYAKSTRIEKHWQDHCGRTLVHPIYL